MGRDNNPEIGKRLIANGIGTNYHDFGEGDPLLLIHGSGPGVSAWANWRFNLDKLAKNNRVIAPDVVGFGFTDRPQNYNYTMENWVDHAFGVLDALGLEKTSVLGNSFGGALALAMAIRDPGRVDKLILMGAAGVKFALTDGLDRVWGYKPSINNMRDLMSLFAFNTELLNDDLVKLRYEASIRPGFQESYASMFPAPRQHGIAMLESCEDDIAQIEQDTLIIHGYEDEVIPYQNGLKLLDLIENSQLHLFRKCGHWTQIEHRVAFNDLIISFLINPAGTANKRQ